MRTLIHKNYGIYNSVLKVEILDYPLRELRITAGGNGIMFQEDYNQLLNDLNLVINFVNNNDNPWENNYE